MMKPPISESERRTLLLIEVTGILHDLGKFHDLFLKMQSSDVRADFDYWAIVDPVKTMPSGQTPPRPAPFTDLAPGQEEILLNTVFQYNGRDYSIAQLLLTYNNWISPYFDNSDPLSLLLSEVHRSSHYEKQDTPDQQRQEYNQTYSASPFGVESQIATNVRPNLTDILRWLPLKNLSDIFTPNRSDWLEKIQKLLEIGIADNRRPINEVSLWNWGWTVGSFAKASLAGEIYGGSGLDPQNLSWRILRINMDILGILARTATLSDLTGLLDTIEDSFKKARQLLESDWAIANQIYNDVTGAYFIFPNMDMPSGLKNAIHQCFDDDLHLQVRLGDDPICANQLNPRTSPTSFRLEARKLVSVPLEQARESLQNPSFSRYSSIWNQIWQKSSGTEICMACGIRPQGYSDRRVTEPWAKNTNKAKRRKLCCVCLQRRGRRSQKWTKQASLQATTNTIWLSEVVGINGRFALFIGCLGIDAWMDGDIVETLHLRCPRGNRDFTKSTSPSRLTGMRRTCEAFWKVCEQDDVLPIIGAASRWAIIPDSSDRDFLDEALGDYHAYEIPLTTANVSLPVVWDAERKVLLTSINLDYLCKNIPIFEKKEDRRPHSQLRQLLSDPLTIREGSEYLNQREISSIDFSVHEVLEDLPSFDPYIRISIRPDTYFSLIPADNVLSVAQKIQQRYVKEFGRVRDRLPLHLSIIFAPRQTPMRAVLKASQRILKHREKLSWEEWELEKAKPENGRQSQKHRTLNFVNGVTWKVPNDDYYPYYYTGSLERQPRVKHLTDLRPQPQNSSTGERIAGRGEKIWVRPSTFDFEFLDTTARRFEIAYDDNGKRRSRVTRPYLLDDLTMLNNVWESISNKEKGLTSNQIYALRDLIQTKREEWQPSESDCKKDGMFWKFCRDAFATAQWPKTGKPDKAKLDELADRAASGVFADVLELRMSIMKEKPKRDSEEESDEQ